MASATLLSTPTKVRIPTMAPTPMGMLRSTDSTAIPLKVECSSRPQKKATAHHVKSRSKKHQPYDKNRQGPTLYPDQIFPLRRAPYLSMALMPKKFRKAYNAYVAENPLVEDDRYPFKQQEERNPRRQQEVEEDREESAPAAVLPAEIVEDDSAPVVVAEDA